MENKLCSKEHIRAYIEREKAAVKARISAIEGGYVPTLAIIRVGNDEASTRYICGKIADCEETGMHAIQYSFPEDINEIEFLFELTRIARQNAINGIIIQKPVPNNISEVWEKAMEILPPEKDVDGFRHDSCFQPCTPKGIMDYIADSGCDVAGKHCVIIGRSDLVGRPLAKMMLDADATVTVCHSKTRHIERIASAADILVSAAGKANMIDRRFVKPNAVVIDVGINFDENGKLCGDVNYADVKRVTDFCTPVPGGVGLLTRIALIKNVVDAFDMQQMGG